MARQKLTYVSNDTTWENIASTLGGIAGNIGNSMIKKYEAIQQADFAFIQNTADKLQNDYIASAFKDGNYEQYQERAQSFKDGFSDALKKATGKDKAVDKWLEKYGDNYWSLFDYNYSVAESNALEALNLQKVDREIEYYSASDGATYEGALEKANSVYHPVLDEYGISNPSNPDKRMSIASQVFSSNMKYSAEKNFNGGISITLADGTTAQKYMTEDEFEEYYDSKFSEYVDFVMQGFDERYTSNPSGWDAESTRGYLESLRPQYKAMARAEYEARANEHLAEVKNKARSVNNAIAQAKLNDTPIPWQEAKEMYKKAGIDVDNDEIAFNYVSGILLGEKDEYEADIKARANEIRTFVSDDKDEIVSLVSSSIPEYVSTDSYQVYSANGVETIPMEQGIDSGVEMYINNSFIMSKGGDDARIATVYGGVVDQFCQKYNITDPTEKMVVASEINNIMYGTAGSSSISTTTISEQSPAMSILNSMIDEPTIDDSSVQSFADELAIQGLITNEEWQQITNSISKSNSIPDKRLTELNNAIKQAASDYGIDNDAVSAAISYNNALQESNIQFLTSNPTATTEQLYERAEKVIAQFATYDTNTKIWKELKSLITDALDGDYNISQKNLLDIIADYNAGNNFFLLQYPNAMADLKASIIRGTFDNINDLMDYTAKLFYRNYDPVKSFTEQQKNTIYDALAVAFYETNQYQQVEQVASALNPNGNFKEVRFSDQTIGIMDQNGAVYRSNGDYNNMFIGKVDKNSDAYKLVFSNNYLNHGIYNPSARTMIGIDDVRGWVKYQPNFTVIDEKSPREELKAQLKSSGLILSYEEIEEITNRVPATIRSKKRSEITNEDFQNDWRLRILYNDVITGRTL